jgi:hypothetical protein
VVQGVELAVPLRTPFDGSLGHSGFSGVGQNHF